MKQRLAALLVAVCLLFTCTGCQFHLLRANDFSTFLEQVAHYLGNTQLTSDEHLIGSRSWDKDGYTGDYQAQCTGSTGQDVAFGGASLCRRTLRLSGSIHTESGKAVVRIRMNGILQELPLQGETFETELSFSGGGNYIMVSYQDFRGTVELKSEYPATVSVPEQSGWF